MKFKCMAATGLALIFVLAGCTAGQLSATPLSQADSSFGSASVGSSSEASTPEYDPVLEIYVEALNYGLGNTNWSSVEEIDPEALEILYFYLASTDLVSIPEGLPPDQEYGNPLVPDYVLEETVQSYFAFEVPKEYLRTSEWYDAQEQAYYTGGIGYVGGSEIFKVWGDSDYRLVIEYDSYIPLQDGREIRWTGELELEPSEENAGGYVYVSHTQTRIP